MPITVSIVEDDPEERDFLVQLIKHTPGLICAGAHRTADSALIRIPAENPNVILLDYRLPEWRDGLRCLIQLRHQLPEARVVMWTIEEDATRMFQALETGACGYLVKGITPDKIIEGIRDVYDGGSPMYSQIARKVIDFFHRRSPVPDGDVALSPRENAVLEILTQGWQYKEIADQLGIKITTVRSHLRNIYEKLHVCNRTEAAVKYSRQASSISHGDTKTRRNP